MADLFDCGACGACCREGYDSVPVEDHDARTLANQADHVQVDDTGWRDLLRVPSPIIVGATRCFALVGDGDCMPWRCTIYEDRPTACSELEAGSENCKIARERLGLPI